LIERKGQATGVVCNLDYRHNAWIPVYLEKGLSLEPRLLDMLAHSSLDDESEFLSKETTLPV
jgi:hypothetical protein